MRKANEIVKAILILKLGEKSNTEMEKSRLTNMVNGLDSDINGGMLSTFDGFLQCLKKQMPDTEISKTKVSMLNAVYKTHNAPKSISMLGKLLFSEKEIQDDYTLVLLYRLLELNELIIRAVPNGYNTLRDGISGNRLLEFTEPLRAETVREFTESDLLKALFIMNDEPDGDISNIKDCAALTEYKSVVSESLAMNGGMLANITAFTSYPNMVLVMGLRALAKSGKTVEFRKETLERLVLSVFTNQVPDLLVA